MTSNLNALKELKSKFDGESIEATKAALLKKVQGRTASGTPTKLPKDANLGIIGHLRSGGVWLLACLLGFCLLTLLMAREQSYERALKAALAGNVTVDGEAGVNSHEATTVMANLNQVNNEKSTLEVALREVQQQLNTSQQENAKQAEFLEVMEREKDGLLKNMTMLQDASRDKDSSEKALSMMNKYKAKLDEKRLQRDAYLHKLQEMGVTISAGKLIKDQRSRGVGVGLGQGTAAKSSSSSSSSSSSKRLRGDDPASKAASVVVTRTKSSRGSTKKSVKLSPRVGGKIVNSKKRDTGKAAVAQG
mmetsp:Transcript_18787/g.41109  ORF Transcript_18787/g.41109 Transcript_18787/m.41109 type:complete len:305 (-) Transcript_18787:284-1198(-)|eukprot:CAMPEP_0118927044 /NCGR_PEP_ID=MMETSP1169-20130426/4617_1 /TAXON_ID=36882 /ORGANISM="Pyramimonas obovata, Strain CCMP722" /LENGTH=304 /DNA_ID=CAMNT_0006868735 /DNA_START=180 /DNA_END=1094 /DNA_ORIENTATION=-